MLAVGAPMNQRLCSISLINDWRAQVGASLFDSRTLRRSINVRRAIIKRRAQSVTYLDGRPTSGDANDSSGVSVLGPLRVTHLAADSSATMLDCCAQARVCDLCSAGRLLGSSGRNWGLSRASGSGVWPPRARRARPRRRGAKVILGASCWRLVLVFCQLVVGCIVCGLARV